MAVPRNDALISSVQGDRYTPFGLAKKLGALAILESASFAQGRARYSLLLLREAFRIRQCGDAVVSIIDGKEVPCQSNDMLEELLSIAHQNVLPFDGIPLPGAGIGFLGYEFSARCDSIVFAPQKDSLAIPESEFIVGHAYLIFDHLTDTIHICALNYKEHEIDLAAVVEDIKKRLEDLDFSYLAPPVTDAPCGRIGYGGTTKESFVKGVECIQEEIREGNLLQCVMSRRLIVSSNESALEVYRKLRSKNPSPYLFYLDFGEYQLVGASPESLVRVKDSVASIRPIAGTRRRGSSLDEDQALASELLQDPKERAEHLMLVDLARNDLGRVCTPGTVKLTRNMDVENFSHVMHIVSEVCGQVPKKGEKGARAIDVLRFAFPAGTVSGAPKIRAIETLSRLEEEKRSFYAGAVGYIEPDGDLDFCISIRCALKKGATWVLQAGAGIVQDSKPEREWEETNEKLRVLRNLLTGDNQ